MNATAPVRATLNYSVGNGIPPDYYHYEPDPSVTLNPPGTDPREVDIHDGWPNVKAFSADREGFELHDFDARFDPFDDEASVKAVFYEQVIRFVRQHTGARRVDVFDHTIRKRLPADRWVYFPQMEAQHTLPLKTCDSETDGRARFMGHTAFEHPNTPLDALKRESIEVRTMAFF